MFIWVILICAFFQDNFRCWSLLAIIIPQQANMKLLSFGLDFEMPNTVIWSASPCGVYTVKQPVSGYFRNLLFIILVPKVGLGSGIFTFLRIYNTCFGSIIIAFSLIAFFGKHIISLDFFFCHRWDEEEETWIHTLRDCVVASYSNLEDPELWQILQFFHSWWSYLVLNF